MGMASLVETKTSVHWLTYAVAQTLAEVRDCLGGGFGQPGAPGGYGQPQRVVHESGAAVYFGSQRKDQPVVVNMPGEVCEGWAKEGLTWCDQLSGKITRVDLANDVGPEDLSRARLVEMVSSWKRGRVQTSMRRTSHSLIKSDRPGEGWTAYFGGRTADLQLRVYDRRGDLRLEWQWRPPHQLGALIPEMLLRHGAGSMWRSLAESAVWPMEWYQQLLVGNRVPLTSEPDESSRLSAAIQSLAAQYGTTFWAMLQLGIPLDTLVVDPGAGGKKLKGELAAKLLRWAGEAEEMQWADGAKLREAVKCRLTSERK